MNGTSAEPLGAKLITQMVIAVVAVAAVVVAAFALSFDAIKAVSEGASISEDLSWLMPVAVDGAITVGTIAALVLKSMERSTWYPWLVVMAGVVVSVACNALHATQSTGETVKLEGWQKGGVSAIPAVALPLVVHLLVILIDAIGNYLEERRAKGGKGEPRTEVRPVREPYGSASLPRTEVPPTILARPVRAPEETPTAAPHEARTEPEADRRTGERSPHEETRTAPVRIAPAAPVRAAEVPRVEVRAEVPPAVPAPLPVPVPSDRNESAAELNPAPAAPVREDSPVSRSALVEELALEIAVQGEAWRPDYEDLMQRSGYSRSWCEKVVRDARNHAAGVEGEESPDARTEPVRAD